MRLKKLAVVFAIGAVLSVAAGAFFLTRQSSSAQTAALPNVRASDFASANITATSADPGKEQPKVSADQALAVATGGDKNVPALAVNLIKLTVAGRIVDPKLTWAVSLDPATAPIPPALGDCGLNNNCTPNPRTPRFMVVFVDANTAAFMFGWDETAAGAASVSLSQ